MLKTYESGRTSSLLADIKTGMKTIEARLNRSKFAKYKPGDQVWLREDFYENGKIIRSKPQQVLVEIKKVETYKSFSDMLNQAGFKNTIPRAKNLTEAINECYAFYTRQEEKQYGVLAIFFKVIKVSSK